MRTRSKLFPILPGMKPFEAAIAYLQRVGEANEISIAQVQAALRSTDFPEEALGFPDLSHVHLQAALFGPMRQFYRRRVCPQCIAEERHTDAFTQSPHVPYCLVHGLVLLERCAGCGTHVMWSTRVSMCRCGYDLRMLERRRASDQALRIVAAAAADTDPSLQSTFESSLDALRRVQETEQYLSLSLGLSRIDEAAALADVPAVAERWRVIGEAISPATDLSRFRRHVETTIGQMRYNAWHCGSGVRERSKHSWSFLQNCIDQARAQLKSIRGARSAYRGRKLKLSTLPRKTRNAGRRFADLHSVLALVAGGNLRVRSGSHPRLWSVEYSQVCEIDAQLSKWAFGSTSPTDSFGKCADLLCSSVSLSDWLANTAGRRKAIVLGCLSGASGPAVPSPVWPFLNRTGIRTYCPGYWDPWDCLLVGPDDEIVDAVERASQLCASALSGLSPADSDVASSAAALLMDGGDSVRLSTAQTVQASASPATASAVRARSIYDLIGPMEI